MSDQQECALSKVMKPDYAFKHSFYNFNLDISSLSLFLRRIYLLLSGYILTKFFLLGRKFNL